MRFLRASAQPVRAVLTAGNFIGATPPSLNTEEQHLLKSLARRSFADVLDQAIAREADLLLIAGGMFTRSEPTLDDVRFASQRLRHIREAGILVLALDDAVEAGNDKSSGLAFLEELGLLHSVSPHGHTTGHIFDVGGATIEVRPDREVGVREISSEQHAVRITLGTDPRVLEPDTVATKSDLLVLGDAPEPARQQFAETVVVRPGWSAPFLDERQTQAGFALVDIDYEGVLEVEFCEVLGASPEVVRFEADDLIDADPSLTIRERLAPLIGETPLVTIEFNGLFPRELWHRCRIGDLSRRASTAGTLVSVDLSRLEVPVGPLADPTTRSFLVEVRRAAERMGSALEPDQTEALDRARRSIVNGLQRQQELRVAR